MTSLLRAVAVVCAAFFLHALSASAGMAEGKRPFADYAAEQASRTAWVTDAVVIYRPVLPRDFWEILARFPVEWVELERGRRGFATAEFDARFEPRPECGPDLYRRRPEPERPPSGGAG